MRGPLRGIREATRRRRGMAVAASVVVLAAAGAAGCGSGKSSGGSSANGGSNAASTNSGGGSSSAKGGFTVVLSNAYMGNAWRKTMVKDFQAAAAQDKQQGLLKDYQVLLTQDNKPTDQIAQLQTQLLKRPDAIVIDAASPTALNPVIQKACAAGIKVIVFDSLVTAPCAYKINHNLVDLGREEGLFLGRKLGGRGNVIELRGISGSEPDIEIHQGIQAGLKQFPGIKVVATVDGEASQTTAQQSVQSALRSLPRVDAVMTQGGGDAYGVIQAFEASGKPVPPIVLGNGGNELQWWQAKHKANGYTTLSISTMPGQSTIALGEAIMLLQGKQVPQQILNLPLLRVDDTTLAAWAKATPTSDIASPVYGQSDVESLVQAAQSGGQLPDPPVPTN